MITVLDKNGKIKTTSTGGGSGGGGGGGGSAPAEILQIPAGEDVLSGLVVYVADGKAYYYDPMDENLYRASIGISKINADTDAILDIQISGVFKKVGLGLIPDTDYFAGLNGTLVDDPTGMKVCQYIGRAISGDEIKINIQTPIITN